MRHHPRLDSNQASIVKTLRMIPGVSAESMASMGHGFPDLIVGYNSLNSGQINRLYEIKVGKGKLTDDEKDWHDKWHGQVKVVHSVDDILQDMGPA